MADGWLLLRGFARAPARTATVAASSDALVVELLRSPGTVADLTAALAAGRAVGVFRGGTTWCGAAAGPFRRAAFQGALNAGVPVRPVAVTLRTADGRPARDAAFVGDQSLLACLVRVLRLPGLVCTVQVLPPIPHGGDRRALAQRAAVAVGAATGIPHVACDPARRLPPRRAEAPAVPRTPIRPSVVRSGPCPRGTASRPRDPAR